MRIVCCQTDIEWEDKAANLARVGSMLEANRPEAGSLVVLPEMFATGFSMNLACVAEPRDGETHAFMADAASRHSVYVVGGVVTLSEDGRGRNESVVFSPQGVEIARYQKIRPFVFGEKQAYAPGERTVQFSLEGASVSPFICFDLRFPEIFRAAARRGTDLFVVIANWPVARIGHWTTLLQARAIENQAYVVGVNRVGDDPAFHYTGRSLVVGPGGEVLLDCGEADGLFSADIDFDALREYRRKLPFLNDLHPDYVRDEGV